MRWSSVSRVSTRMQNLTRVSVCMRCCKIGTGSEAGSLTLELRNVQPELVPLIKHPLAPLLDERVEPRRELVHPVAQVVEAPVDVRERIRDRRRWREGLPGGRRRKGLPEYARRAPGLERGSHGRWSSGILSWWFGGFASRVWRLRGVEGDVGVWRGLWRVRMPIVDAEL